MKKLFGLLVALMAMMFWGSANCYAGCGGPNAGVRFEDGDFYYKVVSVPTYPDPYGSEISSHSTSSIYNSSCYDDVIAGAPYSGNVIVPSSTTRYFIAAGDLNFITVGIGEKAFADCPNLNSVTIPNSVTYVSDSAFARSLYLNQVTFGTGVITLGNGIFKGCYSLQSVTFRGAVPYGLNASQFADCINLETIYVPSDKITVFQRALGSSFSVVAIPTPEDNFPQNVLDLTLQGTSIEDWTINDATLNTKNSDASVGKYVYDIEGGIESESYVASRPNVVFKVNNASAKQKAFVVYPGKCYEFGGKNGILEIKGTSAGDTITIVCAAKSSITDANFLDGSDVYPINANAISEDLTLPFKAEGAEDADEQGYRWKEIQYVSLGGDVEIKEFAGGFRVKRVEIVNASSTTPPVVPQANVVTLSDVANYIDFHTLSQSDPQMTLSNVTSTNPYTLANGTVLRGFLKADESEAYTFWGVYDYRMMPTPEWEGVDSLRAGTFFRGASGVTITLGSFSVSSDGKLVVYYQPSGDSDRGVSVSIYGDEPVEYTRSGERANGSQQRPAYAAEFDIPAGNYMAGDVVIKVIRNNCNIFGVRIENLTNTPVGSYTVTANASPSNAGNVYVNYNAEHTQATITATANYGYRFDHWNDGNTQNPRTVSITKNKTYTAYFQQYSVNPTQPRVWPMMMDDVTYGLNEQYVVNDFRQDSVEKWLYIWENTYQKVAAAGLNFYGNREDYLSWSVTTLGWAGACLYLSSESAAQEAEVLRQEIVANPNDYYLHLAIKSTDNYSHCFYFMANEATKFGLGNVSVYDVPNSTLQNFTRDGEWHEFYIPMAQYAEALSQSTFQNNMLFVLLSEGIQGARLNLDAVYFCNTAYKNNQTTPPVEENYTVTTNVHPIDAGEVQMQSGSNWAVLTATGNTGYHFKRWSDGNLDNPRYVELTQDTTFTALFELDVLEVTYIGMDGRVLGVEDVPYGSTAHRVGIDADEFGYTLTGWDKDLTHVTENMTVTAIYTRDAVNGFYYIYDRDAKTAVLDHEGNSYANIRKLNVPNNFIYRGIKFAVVAVGANAFENCDRLTDVVLPGNVEDVEEYAFSGCTDLVHLTMSANLRGIADYAFNGCKRLEDITVYAQRVPDLTATSFNAIGNKKYVNVYVPDNRVNNYKRDEYWSEFNIVVKSAETVEGNVNDVTVEPEETSAQFTWPTENNAASYTIEITKDGVVFCTLIFNANGQLTGIAFAPGRNGNEAPMATLTANGGGMQFTVTGLDAGTSYAYTVTTKDTNERVIATYEGSFETNGTMEDGIVAIDANTVPQKIMHNGQIYILRGEKVFTLQGVEVK